MSQSCDILIVGAGTGGVAAALALAEQGVSVILTEETDWLGGQLTSQIVPPDEHPWIEKLGCTDRYRQFRNDVRKWYRTNGNLSPQAKENSILNPGGGWVSHLCFLPEVGDAVLREQLKLAVGWGPLRIMFNTKVVSAKTIGDEIISVVVQPKHRDPLTIFPKFVIDATELGDLLPLAGVEYNLGAESKTETQEPNAIEGRAERDNIQSFTWCAALGFDSDPKANHTIEKPDQYGYWRDHQPPNWPDRLLSFTFLNVRSGEPQHFPLFENDGFNLFSYRQIVNPENHLDQREPVTVVNWPMNDYAGGHVIDVPDDVAAERLEASRQLTLSLVYWLQTECGYPGLRLRGDITGTVDGLAKSPYHRESRRIQALHTIKEQDVAAYTNPNQVLAPVLDDSVGMGAYRIDLHPASNGAKTIDTSTLPFTIPMGSLIPIRVTNLLPAAKNIGTTHITNGCYRLHPIEWNIGESAALLALYCLRTTSTPQDVYTSDTKRREYIDLIRKNGIPTEWPEFRAM